MNLLTAIIAMALAALVVAQTDADQQPLMNDYHGLAIVFLGLVIVAVLSLCAHLNARELRYTKDTRP